MSEAHAKTPESPVPISCETTGKLLARIDASGLYLWCKACKCEHRLLFTALSTSIVPWQEMQQHFLAT